MALTDQELEQIILNLTPEERKQLFEQLGKQINAKPDIQLETSPPPNPQADSNSKVTHCIACGSTNYKKHGTTTKGMQRYICKDCGKTFSENHGDSLRYTHISEEKWREILRGIIDHHSIPKIANEVNLSTKTIWLCRQKVNHAIMTMYGYCDLFEGLTEADEFYCRAAFKGKRDPEFFIYTLHRMPRHNRNRQEKIEWLQKAGLYDKLQREDPNYLEELLTDKPKKKRGISNEQICILTLVDNTGKLYIEPVSVGRLKKAMAKVKLKPRFSYSKKNIMVTDDHNAYNRVLYGTGTKHEVIASGKHAKGKYNLAKVNSVHSALASYMDNHSGRVYTTKYLDLNLMLFWWLYKYKEYSTSEKVEMLYKILTDDIADIETREQVNQVTSQELMSREITMDTKGQFPTKL